ncbi:MAG: methyltransferase domain-containing protein [Hyphomonadaceae bacterium]|nr:methyltransferase domain-containing protein [Hyphomonadaceae bacterium]
MDSVLLAASLPAVETALEAGCGAGGALLPAAWRLEATRFTGLEIDGEMSGLARQGVSLNGFASRCEIADGDLAALPAHWENRFDLVFSNPPYFEAARTSPPGEGKEVAYLESLSTDAWVKQMLFAACPKGWIVLIHRAAELASLLGALDRRAGEITVLPIRARAGAPAKRVLVRARKGLRRGPVTLLDGLETEDSGRMEAVLSGDALDWV